MNNIFLFFLNASNMFYSFLKTQIYSLWQNNMNTLNIIYKKKKKNIECKIKNTILLKIPSILYKEQNSFTQRALNLK